MEIIIFQLLSCLFLYDSGIPVPVRIRKQIRYTGFWPVALITVPPVYRLLAVAVIYHVAGIPASGVQRVKRLMMLNLLCSQSRFNIRFITCYIIY